MATRMCQQHISIVDIKIIDRRSQVFQSNEGAIVVVTYGNWIYNYLAVGVYHH